MLQWRLDHRLETESTNVDAVAAARAGEPEGLVVLADRQTAGRGRQGRAWHAPPGSGLTLSLLLRPRVPVALWGWLPLLAGVALVDALPDYSGRLKWPNDLLINDRKCAGILAEATGEAVVVGIGLNLALEVRSLPRGVTATSLHLEGPAIARAEVLKALLPRFADRYSGWQDTDGDPERSGIRAAYRRRCATLGRRVRVLLPAAEDGATLAGTATDVDNTGRLVITTTDGKIRAVAAGDVTHVR